jgi:hypothetical protein
MTPRMLRFWSAEGGEPGDVSISGPLVTRRALSSTCRDSQSHASTVRCETPLTSKAVAVLSLPETMSW